MKIRCADVVVQKRVRNDLGELNGLMESIRLLGLLQPIGITRRSSCSVSDVFALVAAGT